jgi:hypothetical protein
MSPPTIPVRFTSARAHDVTHHVRELQVGIFERFLQAVDLINEKHVQFFKCVWSVILLKGIDFFGRGQ